MKSNAGVVARIRAACRRWKERRFRRAATPDDDEYSLYGIHTTDKDGNFMHILVRKHKLDP